MAGLSIPVSYGEAADKISILEIKRERIRDAAKLQSVENELGQVSQIFFARVGRSAAFDELFARLKEVNGRLWDIEESLRAREHSREFGAEFVDLARAVYQLNDDRARAKRAVDVLLNSPIREEKSYLDHEPAR